MATTTPALPALDNTMGALFIGVLVSTALWGVSCLQIWNYYTEYTKDPIGLKLLVALVFITDTIHEILVAHVAYTYVITNFFNPLILDSVVWSIVLEVLFNGFTAVLVQGFFCFRVYRLSQRNWYLTGAVALLAGANFIATLVYVAKGVGAKTYTVDVANLKPVSISVNVLGAATDVAIAAILCVLLDKSRTGFKQSDSMINKLMLFSVNSGLVTSVCAIMSLIMIITLPSTFIYICFYFTLGRLYNNSLLSTLNARHGIREKAHGTSHQLESSGNQVSLGPLRSGTGQFASPLRSFQSNGDTRVNEISVKIDTTKEYSHSADESVSDLKVGV